MIGPAAATAAVASSAAMPLGTEDDSDADSISTTSTVASEPKSEYDVETVFAEKRFPDGLMRYLVKWDGYPMDRCSWEPEEQFDDSKTLLEWCQKKQNIEEGKEAPFDHEEWQRQQDALQRAKLDRQKRREAKRTRKQLRAQNKSNRIASNATPSLTPASPSLSRPRVKPSPAKPPPVLFGNSEDRQAPHGPLRVKKSSNAEPIKHFHLLSTKRRYEKAKQDEPAPDIKKMELARPSEWPSWPSVSAAKIGPAEGSSKTESKTEKLSESSTRNDSSASTTRDIHPRSSLTSSSSTSASSDAHRSWPGQGILSRWPTYLADRQNQSPVAQTEPVIPQRQPGPRSRFTINGRFFNPNEVLVRLYYGPEKKEIGQARLCGLSATTRSRIMLSKKDYFLEVWFQHLCSFDDYDRLCLNTTNRNYGTGWIEGFDDTEQNLSDMAQDLRQRGLLAVSIPEFASQNALLAYPPDTSEFSFLRSNFEGHQGVSLYLTARSHLGPIERLERRTQRNQAFTSVDSRPSISSPVHEQPHPPTAQGKAPNDSKAAIPEPALPLPRDLNTNHPPKFIDVEPHERQDQSDVNLVLSPSDKVSDGFGELMDTDHPAPLPMASDSAVSGPRSGQNLPPVQNTTGIDVDAWFEEQYGVTFSMLHPSKDRAVVYVMYPGQSGDSEQQCDAQCDVLMAFLQKHTSQTYSSRQFKDWETFTLMERGVALFHENFVDFAVLPSLSSLLQKTFTFWSFSLRAPHDYAGHPAHFQRIFPQGTIFLLTEDVILRKPEKTISFLAWFRDSSKKKFPGTWKLMVRPSILEWVLKQFDKQHPSKKGIWIAMHHLISELGATDSVDVNAEVHGIENVVISPDLPGYIASAEQPKPDNSTGMTPEQRKSDRLAEFFAGWSLVNRHQFRRFVIVSGIEPLDRWKTWQHVIIYHGYRSTMATYKIDYEYYWSKLEGQKGGGPSAEERTQNTPSAYTPQTPRVSLPKAEQPLMTAPMTHNYPQPYQ